MKTQKFEVARLRGMDQRWRVSADSAAQIKEMSWDSYDGWKNAGAYDLITYGDYDWGFNHSEITSIHFLSRHNGSQRSIIFEDGKGALLKLKTSNFDRLGSSITAKPFNTLIDLEGKFFSGTSSATARKRFVPTTSSIGSQSVAFGGRLYLVNGVDEPSVFDGRYVSPAGFSTQPASPSATVVFREYYNEAVDESTVNETRYMLGTRIKGQGLGSLKPKGAKTVKKGAASPNRWLDSKVCGYQYRVSFVNNRGQESPLSDPSNICQFECANGFRRFTALTLPIGGPEVVARRIYRTRDIFDDFGNAISSEIGRNFHFLKEVQDNETSIIEDGISDSNLGAIRDPEDFGAFPAQAKYIASFKNTIFVAGMPNNLIRFSAPGTPEVFPRDNVFDIGDADAGEITGLYATTNALVVFKEHGIFFIKGSPQAGFVAQTLTRDIGCIAPNSIKDVPQTGLVFLSSSGVHVVRGMLEDTNAPTMVVELSTPIKDLVERIGFSAAGSAVGCLNRNNKEYWLSVPTIGKKNNLLLVWHYEIGAWSFRENYPIQCATEVRGRKPYVFFGSHDLENSPGIHVYTDFYRKKNELGSESSLGLSQDDGPVIKSYTATLDYPLYETSPISFSSVFSAVQVGYINCYAVAYGNEDLKTNFKVNRSSTVSLSENKGRKQQHVDGSEQMPVYGGEGLPSSSDVARFDSGDVWGFHRPIVIRYDVSHMHKALTTEFAIQFLQDDKNLFPNRMMIVGWSADVKVGEQRNIRMMTDVLTADKR
jgi:hypothetical protein